ncbi:hypothetical protein TNCV_3085791 [Trichonephila clavipes]|nr:hypothetical protein TNCV_3085791 [Trichonephila clavipes]
MDVCKCIVSLRHEGTLNNRRAANPLVRWKGKRGWRSLIPPIVLPLNWVGTKINRAVTCMVLKVTTNDRGTSGSPNCLRLWQLPFGKDKTLTT